MKRFGYLLIALMLLASCREKEPDMTLTQLTIYEGEEISEISVKGQWNVTVVQDERSFIEIECSAYLLEYMLCELKDGALVFGEGFHLHHPNNTVMNVTIHTPAVRKLEFTYAAQAMLEGDFPETSLTFELGNTSSCKGGHFAGKASLMVYDCSTLADFEFDGESCELKVVDAATFKGKLTVSDTLNVIMNSASHLTTYGENVSFVNAEVSSASSLNMLETEVGAMRITMKEASEASVFVTSTLEGSLRDASTLYYKGDPTLNVDCDETSTIRPL